MSIPLARIGKRKPWAKLWVMLSIGPALLPDKVIWRENAAILMGVWTILMETRADSENSDLINGCFERNQTDKDCFR